MLTREGVARGAGRIFSGCFRGFCFCAPLSHCFLVVESFFRFYPLGDVVVKTSIFLENSSLDPGFGSGAAPSIVDQANWYAEGLVKLSAEEISDSGKLSNRRWRADVPLAVKVILFFLCANLRNADETNVRVVCGCLFQIGIIGLIDGPLHVGLAGANPDFAHHDIGESDLIRAGRDREVHRVTGARKRG